MSGGSNPVFYCFEINQTIKNVFHLDYNQLIHPLGHEPTSFFFYLNQKSYNLLSVFYLQPKQLILQNGSDGRNLTTPVLGIHPTNVGIIDGSIKVVHNYPKSCKLNTGLTTELCLYLNLPLKQSW